MRRLFLASAISSSLDKVTELLDKKPADLKLAFVTTAAHPYGKNPPWLAADREKLIGNGFIVFDVDIKDKSKKELEIFFSDFDIICVGGGNSFYLLEKALKSGFAEVVKEFVAKGKLYIGSSAGSILLGPTLDPIKTIDNPEEVPDLKKYDALGIVDFIILPHFEGEQRTGSYKRIMEAPENKKYKFITLTDDEAVAVQGDTYRIVSSGGSTLLK